MRKILYSKQLIMPLGWMVAIILLRIVPHLPNLSCVGLAAMLMLRGRAVFLSMLVVLAGMLCSDYALHVLYAEPLLGSWTVFTYTGVLIWLCAGRYCSWSSSCSQPVILAFSASILYWSWTNFGTWLLAGLYPHTWFGLYMCFVAGIPFLQSGLLGSVLGCTLLVAGIKLYSLYKPHQLTDIQ
jgi:hypothetical protein